MAEEVGMTMFFPEVFQPGVPDIQPALRALVERERVHRGEDGHVTILHLDDVLEVTKRRDVHSMDPEMVELAGAYMGAGRPLIPLMLDGDAHTKYRKLLDPLFAPKVVAELATRVRALADDLIDGFIADGKVELYNTFCEPLPSMVFLTLLGLPLDDLDFLLWFKNGIIRPDDDDHRVTANTKMIEYLYAELDRREASGEPGDDLIGGFITAEVDGETLTREDVIDITFLLVLAGLDTVAASLSCMVDWLARHPDQKQRLIDDPALLPTAIEELMRYETPVVAGGRYATADFELGDEQIKAGDHLTVCWAAANLDGSGFDDPLAVDFDRAAKRHIAFASGFHRCLGSHLARMELSVILGALHERLPDYALDPDQEPGYNNTMIRTVDPLPLVFTPREV
jgi:cytochrome P450